MGLFELLVIAVVIFLIFWTFGQVKDRIPEPIQTVALVVLVIIVIAILLNLIGFKVPL